MEDLLNIVAKQAARYYQNLLLGPWLLNPRPSKDRRNWTWRFRSIRPIRRWFWKSSIVFAPQQRLPVPAADTLVLSWEARSRQASRQLAHRALGPERLVFHDFAPWRRPWRSPLRWLLELFHLPAVCGGSFVTGVTMANLTALAAARHAILIRLGWDVESQGLFGAPPVTVIVVRNRTPRS